jgi:hypothetical protein
MRHPWVLKNAAGVARLRLDRHAVAQRRRAGKTAEPQNSEPQNFQVERGAVGLDLRHSQIMIRNSSVLSTKAVLLMV